jgi:hypothetical protein
MVNWLEFTDFISLIANGKAIIGVGGLALFSVTGVLHRVGIGRALSQQKLF